MVHKQTGHTNVQIFTFFFFTLTDEFNMYAMQSEQSYSLVYNGVSTYARVGTPLQTRHWKFTFHKNWQFVFTLAFLVARFYLKQN